MKTINKFRGIHWSKTPQAQEIRDRFSRERKGIRPKHLVGFRHSEETKRKLSLRFKGIKQLPRSEEYRRNIGLAHKGLHHTEETKKRISLANKGQTSPMKGKKHTEGTKNKLRAAWERTKLKRIKENHWAWKGNKVEISRRIKTSFEYRQWRSDVFTKDNYTCQGCSIRGGILEAHHIKRFAVIMDENNIKTFQEALNCSELWNINNGRTLCKKCHDKTKKFNYDRNG